jgi:muramoyltetrapeptide carboxypeptidase LdcA involved in peptidoglycan recycling
MLRIPPKVAAGDRVAVVSPSWAAPGAFPWVHERAMRRLREEFRVEPVEYPTTRNVGASPAERAADLMAAFTDPGIRAVLATIGGDDQITVLKYLDPDAVAADPKAFLGYSDNTNLLNWLWNIGIAGYYGGSTMVHLGRPGGLHPVSAGSLHEALYGTGDLEIEPQQTFSEDEEPWQENPPHEEAEPVQLPSPPWEWHNADRVVTGPTWGGCLEIVGWNLAANRWLRPAKDYAGSVLLLETSEEMPSATEVFRTLRNMGERGLLEQFPAIVMGLAKAGGFMNPTSADERVRYRAQQRDAVLRAVADYNPGAVVVFNVDFGHTDPQWVLPYGGRMTVDGPARTIIAHYGG